MANNSETLVTIPDQKGLFECPPKQSLFTISRKTSGMSNKTDFQLSHLVHKITFGNQKINTKRK